MSGGPFFSVIIPTRNRAWLLGECIRSVLEQSFEDFELVVSDNWNDADTLEVLRRFEVKPRFRHVRTERELNMPEHWDFAARQATGRYVLFLNDRMVMRPGVLRELATRLEAAAYPKVCVWGIQAFSDESHVLEPWTLGRDVEVLPSRPIIEDIARNRRAQWWRLPRMVNGCIERALLESLQARFGTIFRPISPDFTSGYIVLACVPEVLCIARPFYVSRGLATSTGLNTQKARGGSYLHSLGKADPSRLVPVKTFSVWNSVFSDFLTVREHIGAAFPDVPLHLPSYFAACLEELELVRRMKPEEDHAAGMTEWSHALSESSVTRAEVEAARQVPYTPWLQLRDAVLRAKVMRPVRRAKHRLEVLRQCVVGPTYAGALDAARRTAQLVRSP